MEDEGEGSGKSKQRGSEPQKTRRQGGQGTWIDVHVGIQRKVSFLNVELNDVTEAHGDFRLRVETFRQRISGVGTKSLHCNVRILFCRGKLVINCMKEQKGRGSLIEAFNGSQHLNITASSGDEIDDDARTSVARGDCWCHPKGGDQVHQS